MTRFTDASLAALKPPETGYATYREDGSPLQLRVWVTGVKTFSVPVGRGKRHTIGRYGEVPLAKAREVARRIRAEKTLGRYADKTLKLEDAKQKYLASLNVRPNTYRSYACYLKHLKSDDTHEIIKVLDQLGPSARNSAILTYKAFFKWCIRRSYIERSPVEAFSCTSVLSRDRLLSDEEVRRIFDATEERTHYNAIVRLCFITGQRREQLAQLKRGYIHGSTCTFPREITKNKRELVIPLGPFALETIELFFDTHSGRSFSSWHRSKSRLDRMCKVDDFRLHDARRYFRSSLAMLCVTREVAEMLVGHVRGTRTDIEMIYDRYDYAREKEEAAALYQAHLLSILGRVPD